MDDIKTIEQVRAVLSGADKPLAQSARGALLVELHQPSRKVVAQAALDTSDTTVFTASQRYRDCEIRFVNVKGSNTTYQWHHRRNGASASNTNAQVKGRTLTIDSPDTWSGFTLEKGEVVSGLCAGASDVSVTLLGIPD